MSDFSDRFSRGAIIVVNHRLKAPRRNRQINLRISFYFFFLFCFEISKKWLLKYLYLSIFELGAKFLVEGKGRRKLWWRRYDIHPGNEKKN